MFFKRILKLLAVNEFFRLRSLPRLLLIFLNLLDQLFFKELNESRRFKRQNISIKFLLNILENLFNLSSNV